VAGRIRSIEKSNDLIGNRTYNLLACGIVPQPTTLLHAPQVPSTICVYSIFNDTVSSSGCTVLGGHF
jgi:hypothetical protein